MARRKSRRKVSRRRRGSLGAIAKIGGGALLKIAGAVAGKVLTNVVDKQLPESGYKKWVAAATPIIGAFATNMISKNATAKQLAEGMMIIGGVQLVQQSGALGAFDYDRGFVALGPSFQNPRGVVAGVSDYTLTAEQAALLV